MHTWIKQKFGRYGVLLPLMLLWAPPLHADHASCSLVRTLLSLEESSREILSTDDATVAAFRFSDLSRQLDDISAYVRGVAGSSSDQGEAFKPVVDFIQSRRGLFQIFWDQGLEAAQAHMLSPFYLAQAQRLRDIMPGRMDCNEQVSLDLRRTESETVEPRPAKTEVERKPGPPLTARRHGTTLSVIDRQAWERLAPNTSASILMAIVLAIALAGFWAMERFERRDDERRTCNIPTRFQVNDVNQPAWIADISCSGARLRIESRFAPGDRGELLIDGKFHQVWIVWVNQHFIGVRFLRRLSSLPQDLAERSS